MIDAFRHEQLMIVASIPSLRTLVFPLDGRDVGRLIPHFSRFR